MKVEPIVGYETQLGEHNLVSLSHNSARDLIMA